MKTKPIAFLSEIRSFGLYFPIFENNLSKDNKIYLFIKNSSYVCGVEPNRNRLCLSKKVIRIVALFIVLAAFAVHVASRLLMPETSSGFNVPILMLMLLSLSSLWRQTARPKKSE